MRRNWMLLEPDTSGGDVDSGAPTADEAASLGPQTTAEPVATPAATPASATPTPAAAPALSTPATPAAPAPATPAAPAAATPTPVAAPAPAPIDTAELVKSLSSAIRDATKPAPVAPAAPAPFVPFSVKPEEMDNLLAEPVKAAEWLNGVLNKVRAEQAQMTIAWVNDELKKRDEVIAPLRQMHQQNVREQGRKLFVEKHPDLKEHVDIAEAVANQLVEQGQKFNTMEEAVEAAAKGTRMLIEKLGPRFRPAAPTTPSIAPPAVSSGTPPRAPASNGGADTEVEDMKAVIEYGGR